MARDADAQAVRDGDAVATALGATSAPEKPPTGIPALVARVMALRPVRVLLHYSGQAGPILAAGMSYQGLFALFAALWVAFSVAGFIIADQPALQDTIFQAIETTVPGLVGPNGAIDTTELLSTDALTWTGAIALAGLLFTALGFLASMRDAIRRIFGLPSDTTFFLLQRGKDLGLALGFGVLILLSAALSIASTSTIDFVLGLVGVDAESVFAQAVAAAITYVVVFLIDTTTLMAAYRVLSRIRIPLRRLVVGGAIGGAALGILKALFELGVVSGVGNNKLLASFAVIIGLLVFLNFACQVLLLGAAWISVGMKDSNIDPRSLSTEELELEQAQKLEEARRLVAKTNLEKAKAEYRAARGPRKWVLRRKIERDVRTEARRRQAVPTVEEMESDPSVKRAGPPAP